MGLERLPSTNSCPRDIRFHPHDPYLFTFLSNSKDNETDLYAAKVSQEGDVALNTYPLVHFEKDLQPLLPDPSRSKQLSLEEQLRQERTRQRSEGIRTYQWSPRASEQAYLVIPHGANLFLLDQFTESATLKLIVSESSFTSQSGILNPEFSPDGRKIAFASDGELFFLELPTNLTEVTAPLKPKQLTFGSKETKRGVPDFLAQEELDRLIGFWWSLDGKYIAFQENDERHVKDMNIVRFGEDSTDNLECHKYPFVGTTNPKVSVGIIHVDDVEAKDETEYERTVNWLPIPGNIDFYLVNVHWCPDNTIILETMPRSQQQIDLLRFEIGDLIRGQLVHRELADPSHWINSSQDNQIVCHSSGGTGISDLCYMLWKSERSGFMHIYCLHITLAQFHETKMSVLWENYELVGSEEPCKAPRHASVDSLPVVHCDKLTSGKFVVQEIIDVLPERDVVYFCANIRSPIDFGIYSVDLLPFGSPKTTDSEGKLDAMLTAGMAHTCSDVQDWGSHNQVNTVFGEHGKHSAVLNSAGSVAIDCFSSVSRSLSVHVYLSGGRNDQLQFSFERSTTLWTKGAKSNENDKSSMDLFACPAADSKSTLFGCIWKPLKVSDHPKPGPTVVIVYGGPHIQRVQNSAQLAQTGGISSRLIDEGYTIIAVDNRGSANRGVAFEKGIRDRLGKIEVEDQVAAIHYLAQQGLADANNVGIYGWSYGGYMSLMCLMTTPWLFKCAVSGAPVTDWRYYDTCYTERYIRTPQENPEGYKLSDVKAYVDHMKGGLLLIHGLIDENVYFQHTGSLLNKLMMSGKQYRLVTLPSSRHGPRTPQEGAFIDHAILDHFKMFLPNA